MSCRQQMVPKINKIEDPYKNIVMDAWTFPVHRGVVSKLRLRTNVSDEYVYRCDMASNDGSHRRKKLKIRFDGKYETFVENIVVNCLNMLRVMNNCIHIS